MGNDYPNKQIATMAMYICRKEPNPQSWQECKTKPDDIVLI